MCKSLLTVLLIMASHGAIAEWMEVDRSEIQITYADISHIDASGSRATLWLLSSYKTPHQYDGKKFLSVKSQYEYNCGTEQFRMLAYSLHSGKKGDDAVLHSETMTDKWKPLSKGSVEEKLWKKICDPSAGWSQVGEESNAMTVYANPYTMRKKGNSVKLWELFDFKAARQRDDGKNYLSVTHQAEYDCTDKQYRTLAVEYHAESMGRGKEVYADKVFKKWEPVIIGSADHLFWKIACGNE